jgi:hypothetical protein
MSTIRVDNFGPSAGGTTYSARGIAKAWLKFDQVSVAVDDSQNTSSVTDAAAGNYYQNLTNAFASAEYASQGCALEINNNATSNTLSNDFSSSSASQNQWWTITNGTGASDTISSTSVHGDLA